MNLSPELTRKVLALAGESPGTPARKKAPLTPPPLAQHRAKLTIGAWLPGLQPVSEINGGMGLKARLRRKAALKAAVRDALPGLTLPLRPPFRVTLHRCGVRLLDDDNLAGSFKSARDVVAEWLGVEDGDTERVGWVYTQEKIKPVGVCITIQEV